MNPEAVFARIADRPGAVWLDGGHEAEGWSILTWDPVEVVTEARDWPKVGRALTRPARRADGPAPFGGGVVGYVGYGAGHVVEPVPAGEPTPEPPVWLGRFEGGLCFRHADQTWHVAGDPSFQRDALRILDDARPLPPPPPARSGPPRTVPRPSYEQAVRHILAWLEAGDCYQVNLTRPVHLDGVGDPFSAYRRLRAVSSAPYGAFLRLDSALAVLSNSPELYLSVRGQTALSQPIKGTRPRSPDPAEDARLADALLRSEKDLAELTMIVDLVRNELGRIARTGTVTTGPRVVTAHSYVHHASQDVQAELEAGRDAWDALAATFPPGSVTGAPKVRACERIAEVEGAPRGVYCGAIGYVADSGDATWSVAIRTAVQAGDRLRYHVGGGIVIASTPATEWEETEAKGLALARALAAPSGQ